jgi:hypothetical protein
VADDQALDDERPSAIGQPGHGRRHTPALPPAGGGERGGRRGRRVSSSS